MNATLMMPLVCDEERRPQSDAARVHVDTRQVTDRAQPLHSSSDPLSKVDTTEYRQCLKHLL